MTPPSLLPRPHLLMPKDEFDFQDPMELNGLALACDEDTTGAMTECFVEEFMRLGYNHRQILALFRNPHYLGMNLALQNRGEPFVRGKITEAFARWGKAVTWPDAAPNPLTPALSPPAGQPEYSLTDPLRAPIPEPNL
jgi:hypothetical protein